MTPAPHAPEPTPASSAAGDERLVDGQEKSPARPSPSPRHETDVDPDEAMAENFRSAFNPRP